MLFLCVRDLFIQVQKSDLSAENFDVCHAPKSGHLHVRKVRSTAEKFQLSKCCQAITQVHGIVRLRRPSREPCCELCGERTTRNGGYSGYSGKGRSRHTDTTIQRTVSRCRTRWGRSTPARSSGRAPPSPRSARSATCSEGRPKTRLGRIGNSRTKPCREFMAKRAQEAANPTTGQ